MSINKTIVALATPPGVAGLAIIRISGPNSIDIADKIFFGKNILSSCVSHTIHYGKIIKDDILYDKCTASIFKCPNSYTGEDIVEFGIHGSSLLANEIINLIISEGADFAEPGEFTKRAFLNGKLDLNQVEAVADLIHSVTIPGTQTAAKQLNGGFSEKLSKMRIKLLDIAAMLELELDFSEEDIELLPKSKIIEMLNDSIKFCTKLIDSYKSAEIMRNGYFVGIAGYPNSGKSTLFNTVIGRNRAIVSKIEGTTRDYLEERIYINNFPITIADTAGLRETEDEIEIEGIKLVHTVLEQSNLILVLNDITKGENYSYPLFQSLKEKYNETEFLYVNNKADLINKATSSNLLISSINKSGIDELKDIIFKYATSSIDAISDVLINQRQLKLLESAKNSLNVALISLNSNFDNEIISIDIRKAVKILGEITGESWNEEVLEHIFSRFCIGK